MMNGKNKVCISYRGNSIEDIDEAIELCTQFEIRLDLCSFNQDEYKYIFSKMDKTIAADHSLKATEHLLKAIELGAKIIDIDINNNNFDILYQTAKLQNRQIIISYHNYSFLPDLEELNIFVDLCVQRKADYAKIACKLNSNRDIPALASLYDNPLVVNGNIKLLAMGMGKYGPLSRLLTLEFGAPFVYCSYHPDSETAEGQLNVFDFLKCYNKLFIK